MVNKFFKIVFLAAGFLAACVQAYAQSGVVKASLTDSSNGDPVSFATVSLTPKGATKVYKYVLSSENGDVKIDGVKGGSYVFKVELMGFKSFTQEVNVKGLLDLGVVKIEPDKEILDAASVSAVGNPIVIKKDTIEFNANSFKTTDNDVLEDLLKKLPGVEVSEDGSVTVNGESVKKITIDGKTFFLDDPQLATKNLPAKIINKVKVVDKKSEQAEFTGIDDGEHETVIDLNIKPGMMKGLFGNLMGGAGHDVPASKSSATVGEVPNDFRYQGAGFLGKFTDKSQISVILNANNTNNRGFNDLSGSMMQGMRGGGGGMGRGQGGWGNGNGITTSYMGGVNGAWTLFDDKMDIGGNYLYNYTDKEVAEQSYKETYLDGRTLLYDSDGTSGTVSGGHRMGVRLEHKFSENTSILFEPRINFGTGNFTEESNYETRTLLDGASLATDTNDGHSVSSGANKNVSTSGFFLLRQRLGIPGRTLTVMSRYSFSNNDLDGQNFSTTNSYETGDIVTDIINQSYVSNQQSSSVMGRATYTEPLGHNFYVEGNYAYNWSKSVSDKETLDWTRGGVKDYTYSNNIINRNINQTLGVNLMYQKDKTRLQAGFAAIPTQTYNSTTKWNAATNQYTPQEYNPGTIWRWSPRAMMFIDFNDNSNLRLFYFGMSSQPSTSQLMPVPDITDPLNISFGNPNLLPYFSHDVRGEFRYNNKQKFASFNGHFEGGFVQDPIVNATWYGSNGAQYSMPFNGPTSANASFHGFLNLPIAKSNFSLMNMLRLSWNKSSNYVGSNVDMSGMPDPTVDYYDFMEAFINRYGNIDNCSDFVRNTIESVSVVDRFRVTYRNDNLELSGSARSRMNHSWYTISTVADNTTTWNNQARFSVVWTWDLTGITLKSDFNYNWYNGYSTAQPDEFVLDAELQKLLFKKKVTLALKGYDILGQSKNLTVTDASNYHMESINNTLGRYIVLSLTYRFGNMDKSKMKGHGPMGGPMGGRGPMGGGPGPR